MTSPTTATPLTLFQANLNACGQRIRKLKESLEKSRSMLPLTLHSVEHMSNEQEESIDALILRYSQCVSMMQDHLFRGIALLEQEDISNKTNRDKTLLMERIGAIQSADAFGTATMLRNKFSHNYPEQAADRVERINLLTQETALVIQTFEQIVEYARAKGYAT